MYIDTHCHLSGEDYDDIDLIIKENIDSGIEKMIVSGCSKNSILESLEFSKKYDCVYVTLGYHPSEANLISDDDLLLLEKQLSEPKVVGVGEIGLDYHYGKDDILKQKELFRKQMKLAEKLSLPVVIHSRDALEDTIEILKEFPNVHGVIHCFSGSLEVAREYIKMGYMLGIGGVVTFKNCKLIKVIEQIGFDNILFETDSPYLTPEPFRGKKNSSKYIVDIARYIAGFMVVDVEDLSKIILNNTYKMFDLK